MRKFVLCFFVICLLFCFSGNVLAANAVFKDMSVGVSYDGGMISVSPSVIDGKTILYLPKEVNVDAVPFYFTLNNGKNSVTAIGALGQTDVKSGASLDLTALCGKTAPYEITFKNSNAQEVSVVFLSTGYYGSLYLTSDDPVNKGRVWVESSADKSNKATGTMLFRNENGDDVYNGGLTQIKGRGNSTWGANKKPYQIKLSEKTDLLESGNKDNASKTWVLLANYYDVSMLRNRIVFDLAAELGMENPIEYTYVNLYYDGEYRGLYQLCEKVEVGDGRVDITDLEGANEDANPTVDFEDLDVAMDKTENGATYYYCEGMNNPDNITGGYLLELDFAVRAVEEVCYFRTKRDQYVVVKAPEFCSKEQMDYIASYYQEYEDALFFRGVNPFTGKSYSEYVDVESVAECYLVNEFSKNIDGFKSSTFLYKEADEDIMTMGPLWDYDLALGNCGVKNLLPDKVSAEGLYFSVDRGGRTSWALGYIDDFRVAVRDVYFLQMDPLIQNVLCGDADDAQGSLKSLEGYAAEATESINADHTLWYPESTGDGLTLHLDNMAQFVSDRNAFLYKEIGSWSAEQDWNVRLYADVFDSDWYCGEVEDAFREGLVHGTGIGRFSPNDFATRAQCVQVFYNFSCDLAADKAPVFTDVSKGEWFAPALIWGYDNEISMGYPDGTFHPNEWVTRQDFVVMLYRYVDSPEVGLSALDAFEDKESVSEYAQTAMAWAVANGVIHGRTETTLCPQDTMTRAEMAALMHRFYQKVNE